MHHLRSVHGPTSERGSALAMSLLVLLMLSVLGLSLLSLSLNEVSITANWKDYTRAFYGAEAGVESSVANLRTLLAQNPDPADSDLRAIAAPALNPYGGVTLAGLQVSHLLAAPPYAYNTQMASGPYADLNGIVTDYQINVQATSNGGTRANLNQTLQYIQVPLFQFGVFYGRGVDLEIAPGPAMTFNGRVHANSNIYVGAGSTLRFDSYMTAAGHIYRQIKRDPDNPWGNNPQIKDKTGTYRDLNFDFDSNVGFGSNWTADQWKAQAQSTFQGTVKDGTMGVNEIIPPVPELFYNPSNPDVVAHELVEMPQPSDSAQLRAAKLYSQAGLRIVNGAATDAYGNAVALPAGILSSTSFYDKREGKTVTVTQVDMGALRTSGVPLGNGLLYVTDTGGSDRAVRLVNGTQLPSGGLSVASPNPVYVQGDYNTINKVPAAVMADAITVLSNNWSANNSDGKGTQVTTNRPASNTTVNAAFALGPSAESSLNNGNGQLENSIRFLEDWSGKSLNYAGSIVALWHSRQATGAWQPPGSTGSAYYQAPNRNWAYDTLFNTQQPPGTPRGVIMARGRWTRG